MDWLGPAVDVRPLFGRQHTEFTGMLRALDAGQWARPTVCPGWTVHDVAAHVLGDHLGRLSMIRDGFQPLRPREHERFPAFLDRINDEWVTAARRISPPLLVVLLTFAGDQVVDFWQTVDLDALGGPVTWAGPGPAPVWLDAARDFTEYWTHHQQIADATGHQGPDGLGVVVDVFMRALPHTLRGVDAPVGTAAEVIVGEDRWTCVRTAERWALTHSPPSPDARTEPEARIEPDARVELAPDTAWRLCTRGITPGEAAGRARVRGDHKIIAAVLEIVSIIWDDASQQGVG
jgi:uncharacterized protein (TIGR03083 family)